MRQPQVLARCEGESPASSGSGEEADLEEVGFDDVFEGAGVFVHGGGDGFEADGSTFVDGADGFEEAAVEVVEAQGVDGFEGEGAFDGFDAHDAFGFDLGEVADSSEQPVCDSGGAASAVGDHVQRGGFGGFDAEEFATALEDAEEFGLRVVLEVVDDAEARAQWGGEQACAGGGADEREGFALDLHRARGEARVDGDVDAEVFHRGVDELFDGDGEAVDFVDEEDVAVAKACEGGDEVGASGEGGAAGDLDFAAHFLGEDVCETSFAQAWWAVEERVFEWFASLACGVDGDLHAFDEVGLADVFVDFGGAERPVELFFLGLLLGGNDAGGGQALV